MKAMERLLTSTEVAELLGLPVSSLYAQRYRGEPPGSLAIPVGRFLRLLPSDIEAFVAERRQGRRGAGS